MKKTFVVINFILTLGFVPQNVLSQDTVYLSNLGEAAIGGSVGSGEQSFETGASDNGYMLNSVTLLMDEWAGDANNFSVSIYSDNNGEAGILTGTLNGNADPETAGQYIYTTSSIILNPNTIYWIVATCDMVSSSPFPTFGYAWQTTSSSNYASANGWNIGADFIDAPISPGSNSPLLQFSLSATPVPEPSTLALAGAAIGVILTARLRCHFLPIFKSRYRLPSAKFRKRQHLNAFNLWRHSE
jgi:PEP-CTERM motif